MANELPRETVDLVVDTVARNYPLVARFYTIKREILGLDTLTHYDRYAPLFDTDGVVTFPDARQIVLDAFGDFSPAMRDRAGEFFDKGWIDAPPAKGKEGGAYCQYVTPDLHPLCLHELSRAYARCDDPGARTGARRPRLAVPQAEPAELPWDTAAGRACQHVWRDAGL